MSVTDAPSPTNFSATPSSATMMMTMAFCFQGLSIGDRGFLVVSASNFMMAVVKAFGRSLADAVNYTHRLYLEYCFLVPFMILSNSSARISAR